MLIRLSCNCHVAAEEIAEVTVSDYGHITVRMKNSVGHPFEPAYGEAVYAAKDRLVREINKALANELDATKDRFPVLVEVSDTTPPGEVHLRIGDKLAGKITNLEEPT